MQISNHAYKYLVRVSKNRLPEKLSESDQECLDYLTQKGLVKYKPEPINPNNLEKSSGILGYRITEDGLACIDERRRFFRRAVFIPIFTGVSSGIFICLFEATGLANILVAFFSHHP